MKNTIQEIRIGDKMSKFKSEAQRKAVMAKIHKDSTYSGEYMTEQERQDRFVDTVGRNNAEKIQRIWNNSYPRYCSLNDEYPTNHTKEEIFIAKAKEEGIPKRHAIMFLEL